MSRWFVLFDDGPPTDWRAAAALLRAAIPRFPLADATLYCRRGYGLVPVPLSGDEAVQVAAALSARGLRARGIPESALVRPPPARVLTFAAPAREGLHLPIDLRGTMRVLPWSFLKVALVDCVHATGLSGRAPPPQTRAAIVAHEEPQVIGAHELAELAWELVESAAEAWLQVPLFDLVRVGAALRELRQPPPSHEFELPERPPAPEHWLELFAVQPPLRLRIRAECFAYDYLGERRALAAHANFRELVADVGQLAPHLGLHVKEPELVSWGPEGRRSDAVDEREHERAVIALLTREAVGRA